MVIALPLVIQGPKFQLEQIKDYHLFNFKLIKIT